MRRYTVLLALPVLLLVLAWGAEAPSSSRNAPPPPGPFWDTADGRSIVWVSEAYGRLPLSFEANQGQSDPEVRFLARSGGATLFLTPGEAILAFHRSPPSGTNDTSAEPDGVEQPVLRMALLGANPTPEVAGEDELPGKVHYLLGNDPALWRTDIPTYARVRYRELYPGIDLVYYGVRGTLEYDFVLAPGADAEAIRLAFPGAGELALDEEGNLLVPLVPLVPLGAGRGSGLTWRAPRIYQEVEGERRAIEGGFLLLEEGVVGFWLGAYDPTRRLVIDPTLAYSTYLGGSSTDAVSAIAVDSSGNAYVAGETDSINFPKTTGAFQTGSGGVRDAFVAKLNSAGSALAYSTYLGGGGFELALAIALDGSGNAYVAGYTDSSDFPTTTGAFQTTSGGADAFVAKLNSAGSALAYSTYLGGSGLEMALAIAVDSSGNAYVAGQTHSSDFPTQGPLQGSYGGATDGFVAKVNLTTATPTPTGTPTPATRTLPDPGGWGLLAVGLALLGGYAAWRRWRQRMTP